jgi:hypothetical protein
MNSSSQGTVDRELAAMLSETLPSAQAAAAASPCIVSVTNATPPEWQVLIVAAATQFTYQDANGNPEGAPTTDVQSPISVPNGGSVTMQSAAGRCVRYTTTVFYIVAPGEQPIPFGGSEDATAQYCLTYIPYVLAPTQSIQQGGPYEGVLQRLASTRGA